MGQLQIIKEQEVLGKQFKIYGDKDNPLFLAKDVASWIEHSDVSTMLRKIDEDEKLIQTLFVSGQNREVAMLTEDGLYEVLMQSRKPIAKQFKKEVKKILKQIRQTGGYIPTTEDDTDEELLARAFLVAQRTIEKKDKQLEEAKKLIEEQEPKVDYHDNVLNSNKLVTTTDVAKDFGMSAQVLNLILKEKKIIYKQSKTWKLYAKHQNRIPEYCDYQISEFGQSLKWTEKGRKWIIELLNNN